MKADLHVHSYHSGYNHDLPFLRSRDCYTPPAEVYRTAKARGMDLVTITDHDSISCWLPDSDPAIEVHLGAYGLTEQAHRDIQPLRGNAWDVIAYLQQQRIFF